jgi:transposase
MRKIVYAERRSGDDRRMKTRRSLGRFLRGCLKPSTYRRSRTRRTFYVRRDTYVVYEPDY